MNKLKDVIKNIDILNHLETDILEIPITSLSYDSRKAQADGIFVAVSGWNVDGHNYIAKAYAQGCRIFVVRPNYENKELVDALFIQVQNTKQALALMSANFFENPQHKLKLIGITGTKGKTSCTFILRAILEGAGHKTGIIGTNGAYCGDFYEELPNTTPESYEIYRLLAHFLSQGAKYAVMEVSSLAVLAERTYGLEFDYGIFTNFSEDHIGDFEHSDMEEYFQCKSKFLQQAAEVWLNADDPHYLKFANTLADHHTYSLNQTEATITANDIVHMTEHNQWGQQFTVREQVDSYNFTTTLLGDMNIYNLLPMISLARKEGCNNQQIQTAIANLTIPGRMEVYDFLPEVTIVSDAGHNMISVQNALKTVRQYLKPDNKVITVLSTVGDQSQIRRRGMGKAASENADILIFTSSWPKFESSIAIIEEMCNGINPNFNGEIYKIPIRREAIFHAIKLAQPGDIVITFDMCGYRFLNICGKKYPYDEKQTLKEACLYKLDKAKSFS